MQTTKTKENIGSLYFLSVILTMSIDGIIGVINMK